MAKVIVTGEDWRECYLQEDPDRKRQVLEDLQEQVEERSSRFGIKKGDWFTIDIADHSTAVETFRVLEVEGDCIKLIYAGGAS